MRREPSLLPRVVGGVFFLGAGAMLGLGGCGSRGPLDDEATNVTATDAAVDSGPSVADAAPEAEAPVVDAGREASAISCGTCVLTTCGRTILACLQSEPCRAVFQCVAGTCLGGGSGGLDPICLFKCANGDPSGALGVLSVFQCISQDCGADCGSLLGGIGGIPGLPGGGKAGGGNGGNGNGAAEARAFRELFSPWPELYSPATAPPEQTTPH